MACVDGVVAPVLRHHWSPVSADLHEGDPSAAPATQNKPEVLQVLRLPRKNEPASQTKRRPKVLVAGLPPTSMKVLRLLRKTGLRSEPEVLRALGLPRKSSLRCSKCCACHQGALPEVLPARCSQCCAHHAKRGGTKSPGFVLMMLC